MRTHMQFNSAALRAIADSIEAGARLGQSEALENVVPIRFDLTSWVHVDGEDFSYGKEPIEENLCNTTCCIAGAACAIFMPRAKFLELVEMEYVDGDDFAEHAARFILTPCVDHDEDDRIIESQALETWLFMAHSLSVWMEVADHYGWKKSRYGGIDSWDQIKPMHAAQVLRDIADGKITPPPTRDLV